MDINKYLSVFNETFTIFCVFPLIIFLGLYLTIRLKGLQVSKLGLGFRHLLNKDADSNGNISHFEAISTVLAGNFGTGNISGMAVAISTGGPGALVWMWVMAFFGAAIQYVSCVLGVKYRLQNEEKEYVGGPMYYLSHGLGFRKLAILFSVLTLFAAVTVGNFAQVHSMSLPLQKIGVDPLLFGLVIAFCVAIVLIGGIERLAKFASLIVPLKAFLYLGVALIILLINYDKVGPAFLLMWTSAVNPDAVAGGLLGGGVYKIIATGFNRGIFATDAGTGIVPILQSSARSKHPVTDGLVTLVAPFMVMVVCTATGLILLISGAWQQEGLQSTNMVTYAFREGLGHPIGEYIVIAALILFGFTTILAWACCAEKAMGYMISDKWGHYFKYLYIALIPVGVFVHLDMVWILADICITAMLVVNIIGIAGLSKEVIADSHQYLKRT